MESIIADLLVKHYGLTGRLTALPGDRDCNFQLATDSGEFFVAKLMHATCTEQVVDFQCAALQHLAEGHLCVPGVIQTLSGNLSVISGDTGDSRIFWVLSWCEGRLLAEFTPRSQELARSFGEALASLTTALSDFHHPGMKSGHAWELTRALEQERWLGDISGNARDQCAAAFAAFRQRFKPIQDSLPWSVVHNDANDHNVLLDTREGQPVVTGIFDFGDMSLQPVVCDVAIALAYLILDEQDPLTVCRAFLVGYSAVSSLSSDEIAVLFTLIKARLAVSIAISSHRQLEEPADPYIVISQKPAIAALQRLSCLSDELANCAFRQACGLPALDHADSIMNWLAACQPQLHPVIAHADDFHCIDLSVGSTLLGANPANASLVALTALIKADLRSAGVSVAYGRYGEPRGMYNTAAFGACDYPTTERRTEHLGVDIFCPPGTPVHAPLDAVVELVHNNDAPLDYGPLVILRHSVPMGRRFYSLYGHLARGVITSLQAGQQVRKGDVFAMVGDDGENGGWTPHLHIQLILDLLGLGLDFPGVVKPAESALWREICPNPAWLLAHRSCEELDGQPDTSQLVRQREKLLGHNLSLSYAQPLHIVCGYRQFLYDSQARAYLDVYNNVAHVGHSHPRVVDAIQSQTALLNTNTRYLHENILEYARRLTKKLPDELDTCFFVNSASEANELALRLARTFTGRRDMLVVQAAYHGHTSSLVEMSPYKYNGPGGMGPSEWVHEVPLADDYRGIYRRDHPEAGKRYAQALNEVLQSTLAAGRNVAGFIAETLPSVGGQIQFPPGYLTESYRYVRAAGGLCIADEVQIGFGRLGDCFWGFESEMITPDIIVLGKPIANGYPLGAVITRREIANRFANGMEFFSTFGGNPVACAAGLAVLDVLEEEELQANALHCGQALLSGLNDLKSRHPVIGDVRGRGFFLGIELVRNRDTLEPGTLEAHYAVNRLRDAKILAGTDGPLENVIKLRPSMVTEAKDLDFILTSLDSVFGEISNQL